MTDQHFDGLSAVGHSPQGYPQPFLPNIELYGRYLRFLEHAFEWPQMTWRYAPYLWGRKPSWVRTLYPATTPTRPLPTCFRRERREPWYRCGPDSKLRCCRS